MMLVIPTVQYQIYLQYLLKLCQLIYEKYNSEVIHGEDEDLESDFY